MLVFDAKDYCVFTTQGFFDETKAELELENSDEVWESIVEYLKGVLQFSKFLSGEYRDYIDLFATGKDVIKPFAILITHGMMNGTKWAYENDKGRMKSVQSWVQSQDGKFACIACYLCNPNCATVKAKKSLLILPDRTVGGLEQNIDLGEQFHLNLIHPKEGEIDGYTLEYHIRKLRKR